MNNTLLALHAISILSSSAEGMQRQVNSPRSAFLKVSRAESEGKGQLSRKYSSNAGIRVADSGCKRGGVFMVTLG